MPLPHRIQSFLGSCTTPDQRELRDMILEEINKKPVLCFKHEGETEDGVTIGPAWISTAGQQDNHPWVTLPNARAMAKSLGLDMEEM